MTIKTKIISTLEMEDEEKEILTNAYFILEKLRDSLSENTVLISDTTGEIIENEELARVLGILSGLIENKEWRF